MKPVQLILIAVALVAALGAGFMMMNLSSQPAPVVNNVVQAPTVEMQKILVASEDIPMGSELRAERLSWQQWPKNNMQEAYINQEAQPEALDAFATTIARSTFYAGEPIREAKIVRSDSGYLSAILPAGKRAVGVRVEAETSAGGFILPNDHVDVIMTYRNKDDDWITETVLANVRVLAIDQEIEEKDGEKTKVGSTATLELTPAQSEAISTAKNIAQNRLMLALRSIEDSDPNSTENLAAVSARDKRKKNGSVKLIRYGKDSEIKTRN